LSGVRQVKEISRAHIAACWVKQHLTVALKYLHATQFKLTLLLLNAEKKG
jgi:hypothetical protein